MTRLVGMAIAVGVHKPDQGAVRLRPGISSFRASSPHDEQGGKWPFLIPASCCGDGRSLRDAPCQESSGPVVVGLREWALPFPGPDRPHPRLRSMLPSSASCFGSLASLGGRASRSALPTVVSPFVAGRRRSAHADNDGCVGGIPPLTLLPPTPGLNGPMPCLAPIHPIRWSNRQPGAQQGVRKASQR